MAEGLVGSKLKIAEDSYRKAVGARREKLREEQKNPSEAASPKPLPESAPDVSDEQERAAKRANDEENLHPKELKKSPFKKGSSYGKE